MYCNYSPNPRELSPGNDREHFQNDKEIIRGTENYNIANLAYMTNFCHLTPWISSFVDFTQRLKVVSESARKYLTQAGFELVTLETKRPVLYY